MKESTAQLAAAIENLASQFVKQLADYLPNLVGGIALLLLGWIVARLTRVLTVRLLGVMDGAVRRLASERVANQVRISQTSSLLLGNLVFWVIVLVFMAIAARQLGLESFTQWLDDLVSYLPTLISGVLIVLVGYYLGLLARDAVHTATARAGLEQPLLLGRVAQAAVLITALVIGAGQIGVNVTLIVVLTAIVLGALLGGAALAFSLGARQMVGNLLAAQQLRRNYRIGESIRIGEFTGTIVEIGTRDVVLETEEGQTRIPASYFEQHPCVVPNQAPGDGER